jgi:hypothetical protein
MEKRHVVITTDKDRRGVFCGLLVEHDEDCAIVVLEDAQMCVRWTIATRGVLGLANPGPTKDCRITPVIPKIRLDGVTAIMDMTPGAVERWRAQPWG